MKSIYSTIMIVVIMVAALGLIACSNKQAASNEEKADETITESGEVNTSEQDIKLIKEWYEYVFGVKEISDNTLDKFLSSDVKKKLWTEDYDGVYEYWRFRTTAQDYNPEVGDVSKIENVSLKDDGWYEVTYLDMGNKGKTKVKIDNNKIVDFVQDSSWDSWDTPVDDDSQGDDSYSSSTEDNSVSKERLIFSNEQYIIGYLLNQRFRHSSGLEIRFDGDGRIYIDGDPAGVISVVRHDSESAILRYGNGMYGEGKLFMQYANGKIQLTDTADGSVFFQK